MAKKVTPKSAVPAASPAPSMAEAAPAAEAMKATKAVKPKATPSVAVPATQPLMVTEEMIAQRAYYKWQNGEQGDHHHHWVSSERELRGND